MEPLAVFPGGLVLRMGSRDDNVFFQSLLAGHYAEQAMWMPGSWKTDRWSAA